MTENKKLRCAAYTRKSTEEGLEQDFNSLDAQREACEAYVHSQASLGWKLVKEHYDDGGISGGTMERPALQRLLQDIQRGRVDVIVVYKIDRLTRSLMDFAKMVKIFDSHQVSFVSVTQQFNATTSMGRLTLNVLLSFAQFEREVTAERIRDKIAASKKKGIYMGGHLPLGYEAKDKRLVINQEEAKTIRRVFKLYLKLGSVSALKRRLDDERIFTKKRQSLSGKKSGGKSFSPGNLYALLKNKIYLGHMVHKDQSYPGSHEPIIDEETWATTQIQLASSPQRKKKGKNDTSGALLKGLIYDERGDVLTPTYSVKERQRYYYYISHRILKLKDEEGDGWRLPARQIEEAVVSIICKTLNDERKVVNLFNLGCLPLKQQRKCFDEFKATAIKLESSTANQKLKDVGGLITRIDLSKDKLQITFSRSLVNQSGNSKLGIKTPSTEITPVVSEKIRFKKRGVEARLIIGGVEIERPVPDQSLVSLVTRAHEWLHCLTTDKAVSIHDLAEQTGLKRNEISRFLPLAFLAPDITQSIIQGTQPFELTADRFRRIPVIPNDWNEQRQLFGFAS